jgi:hypothetical protein
LIRSSGFRKAVLREAVDGLLAGDVDTGQALLRDRGRSVAALQPDDEWVTNPT